MRENRIIALIEAYGLIMSPEEDISTKEAKVILHASQSNMEIVGNSYLYGYINGMKNTNKNMSKVPLYNIPMMSDEKWNQLAERNRLERLAAV